MPVPVPPPPLIPGGSFDLGAPFGGGALPLPPQIAAGVKIAGESFTSQDPRVVLFDSPLPAGPPEFAVAAVLG